MQKVIRYRIPCRNKQFSIAVQTLRECGVNFFDGLIALGEMAKDNRAAITYKTHRIIIQNIDRHVSEIESQFLNPLNSEFKRTQLQMQKISFEHIKQFLQAVTPN